MKSVELKETRAKLIADARSILDKAQAEDNRNLSDEETAAWDKLMAQADELEQSIKAEERREYQDKTEAELKVSSRKVAPHKPNEMRAYDRHWREALRAWFLAGTGAYIAPKLQEAAAHCGVNLTSRHLTLNLRADDPMGVGDTNAGAEWVAQEFIRELTEKLKAYGGMRQACRTFTSSTGAPAKAPSMDDTANVGEIVGEHGSIGYSIPIPTADVTFTSFKYSSKPLTLSIEWLQDSAFPVESIVSDALATRIGRIQNTHMTKTGNGSTAPQAIVGNVTNGLDTNDGDIVYADLVALETSLDPAYRNNCRWMMNANTLGHLKSMVDGASRPLWIQEPNLSQNAPGTLLGYSIVLNQDLDSKGTDKYPILFGDFSRAYWIRDVGSIEFFRFDELYMSNGELGYVAFLRSDGRVVNEDAVVSLKT